VKLTTACPSWVYLTSGSRPRFPINMTLFTPRGISVPFILRLMTGFIVFFVFFAFFARQLAGIAHSGRYAHLRENPFLKDHPEDDKPDDENPWVG
jgi:hypothetical protein